jgi:hypothetical protein
MPTPDWPTDATSPPLLQRDGTALPPPDVARLLHLLRHDLPVSVPTSFSAPLTTQPWCRALLPEPLRTEVQAFRERCGERALDAWMASLLRAWLQDFGTGTARKIRWVVPSAAILGGDACALLIGAHLRGQNYDLRCPGEVGVGALVEMGTRGAILELAHLGRKCAARFRGKQAHDALQAIARAQGLTPDQMQDQLLPDGGLDALGRRTFDYGPRQFELLLDDHLTPILRAPDGRRLTALPKPTSRDDPLRATQSRDAWKTGKAQIQQTARWLASRFETAMISGETWSADRFSEHFMRHPLARHVVRRLLWASTAPNRASATCFRIAEDDTLADSNDVRIDLPQGNSAIGPVHPLGLEPGMLETWQRLFAEYRFVGPFPQLDRPVFRLREDQAVLRTLTSFPHSRVQAKALVFPLENRGWVRQGSADGGILNLHSRHFPGLGVTAHLEYLPGAFLGDLAGSGLQDLTQLYFVELNTRPNSSQALPFGKVPPVVYSETLRDLHALVPTP